MNDDQFRILLRTIDDGFARVVNAIGRGNGNEQQQSGSVSNTRPAPKIDKLTPAEREEAARLFRKELKKLKRQKQVEEKA